MVVGLAEEVKESAKEREKKFCNLEDIMQKGPDTTRIVTLSDTHKNTKTIVKNAVDLAIRTGADAILVAGDFVDGAEFYEILKRKGYNEDIYREWDSQFYQIMVEYHGKNPEERLMNFFEINSIDEKTQKEFLNSLAYHMKVKNEVANAFVEYCKGITDEMQKEFKRLPESCKVGILLGNHEPTLCYRFFPKEWLIPDGHNKQIMVPIQGGMMMPMPWVQNEVLKINDHFQVIGHVGSSERYVGLPDELYDHLSSARDGKDYTDEYIDWLVSMGYGTKEEILKKKFETDETYNRLQKNLKAGTIVVTHKSSAPHGADHEKHPDSIDTDWGAYHAISEAVRANPENTIVEMTGHMHTPKISWRGVTPIQRTEGAHLFVTDFDNNTKARKNAHMVKLDEQYDPGEVKAFFEEKIPQYNRDMRVYYGIEDLFVKGVTKRKPWELN
ncbi:metallophosphoesterase [Candidatus Woesearchaeota archaeon]|nr:metallophosphoesterase [Candidatus Woesearchaeota archaeon]MBW3018395.1 metallophosphoesterase [Candidatus Woesearchaeota archaeon]